MTLADNFISAQTVSDKFDSKEGSSVNFTTHRLVSEFTGDATNDLDNDNEFLQQSSCKLPSLSKFESILNGVLAK